MTNEQREFKRKKRVLEYAERNGSVKVTYRRFGIARSTFYLSRDRYRKSGDQGLARRWSVPHRHPGGIMGPMFPRALPWRLPPTF